MRILLIVLAAVLVVIAVAVVATPHGAARTMHTTHIADTHLDTEFKFVRRGDGSGRATFECRGVRYETTDARVLIDIETTLAEIRTRETDQRIIERKTFEIVAEIMERAAAEGKAKKV